MANSEEAIRTALENLLTKGSQQVRIKAARALMELDRGQSSDLESRVESLEGHLRQFLESGDKSFEVFINSLAERIEMLERRASELEG